MSECTGSSGRIARSLALSLDPSPPGSVHVDVAFLPSASSFSFPLSLSPIDERSPSELSELSYGKSLPESRNLSQNVVGAFMPGFPLSLPSFLLSISSRSGDCGGRRWPRLAFPLSPVVSASAHSHTQAAAAEASDIAPGAEKGIFSSVVNVIYFGMFKYNKGKGGFALPTCMKLGVRCRIALCALSVFWWARSAASTSFPTIN